MESSRSHEKELWTQFYSSKVYAEEDFPVLCHSQATVHTPAVSLKTISDLDV